MADQAYQTELEIREGMLAPGHGRAKLERAGEFTRKRRRAVMALTKPGVA
jgi:hypothetical protein